MLSALLQKCALDLVLSDLETVSWFFCSVGFYIFIGWLCFSVLFFKLVSRGAAFRHFLFFVNGG